MLQTEFRFGEVNTLADQIKTSMEKPEFQAIFGNDNGGVTLLAFQAGQGLTTHQAPAEVMVYVLDGEISFTMGDTPHTIGKGQFLLMGAGVNHSVTANTDAKVMLVKIKP